MARRSVRITQLAACLATGLLVLLAAMVWLGPGRSPIVAREQFFQLRPGLSLSQVEEILGGPGKPVWFESASDQSEWLCLKLDCPGGVGLDRDAVSDPANAWCYWDGEEYYWVVHFKDGATADWFGLGPRPPGLIERVRRWCGW